MDRTTIDVYETRATEWRDRRGPPSDEPARSLRAAVDDRHLAGPIADLGCGPGWYTAALGPAAIALDGARAMLDLVTAVAPDAALVRADLARLPFRTGSLAGAWASRSHVHLPRPEIPLALHDLHRALAVGAPADLELFPGDAEHASYPLDDFPGRRFSLWPEPMLRDVLVGAGFSIDSFEGGGREYYRVRVTRERTLADTVGAGMQVLVCGLNPSVYAADAGVGFARPGNRFWPAAREAGLVSRDRDPIHALRHHGIGMTDLVKRATPRADELDAAEYATGWARVARMVAWLQPGVVVFVGLSGWRAAVDRRAAPGLQPQDIGGRPAYVMPSTSGVNARVPIAALVEHLRAAVEVAGSCTITRPDDAFRG